MKKCLKLEILNYIKREDNNVIKETRRHKYEAKE